MKVLFLTSGTVDPATRFRAKQFFPHFESRGIECDHQGAYGDLYNRVFQVPVAGSAYKAVCRLRRAALTVLASGYDVIFLQRTALNSTALPEWLLSRRMPQIVFDFDDAIFLGEKGEPHRPRERTFSHTVALSHHVIAGNSYLADRAGSASKTSVIPTVIDTEQYLPEPVPASNGIVIGWMGTAGNFSNFSLVLAPLREILREFPHVVLKIVSNAVLEEFRGHPQVEQSRWSAHREVADLNSFDIGIMPLEDTLWTRGKCGFKLIQYMSVGRPVVASPVGANREILEGGAGLMASTEQEWYAALRSLIGDEEARRDLGASARNRVVSHYSVESVVDRYPPIFESAANAVR